MSTMNELTRKALEEHDAQRVAEQKEKDAAINGSRSGGVAFDRYGRVGDKYKGLTKREHFAGLAMQGILSSGHVMDFAKENEAELMSEAIAIASVNYADALLRELEK